jgi:hypothetical protein
MESHFEINVALNGYHFFATAPRSARYEQDAKKIFDELKARFPEPEYTFTVTHWKGAGEHKNW